MFPKLWYNGMTFAALLFGYHYWFWYCGVPHWHSEQSIECTNDFGATVTSGFYVLFNVSLHIFLSILVDWRLFRYIILQGLSGAAGGFLQIVPLIIYYVKLFILGSTPRSVYNIKYGARNVAWGTTFPGITLLVVISWFFPSTCRTYLTESLP